MYEVRTRIILLRSLDLDDGTRLSAGTPGWIVSSTEWQERGEWRHIDIADFDGVRAGLWPHEYRVVHRQLQFGDL